MPHTYADLLELLENATIITADSDTNWAATSSLATGNPPSSGVLPTVDISEVGDLIEADDDPHRLARVNLERYATRLGADGQPAGRTLRYWRDEWYVWKCRYQRITDREFRAKLTASIREEFVRLHRQAAAMAEGKASDNEGPPEVKKISPALIGGVMQATSGMVCISSDIEPNTWLPDKSRRSYLSMANGILDIEAVMESRDDSLLPNDPRWFSMVSLPYGFDPDARCPEFEAFLLHNQNGDLAVIKILQEWAGYLLLPTTGHQRFMILEGEGANGKSVFIAALTAMLGEANVSNIALENFSDRFARTDTLGKLLNAAGDCGELDKAAEGFLKSFTGGDRMYFDRKGIAGLNCRPTARLMVATNNRPHFSDRTQALWRRMLPIPWKVTIEAERRIFGMDTVEWWQNKSELPGILNWAILGLKRLREQGGFSQSQTVDETLKEYQEEMNPARVFLQENMEIEQDHRVKTKEVFRFYRKWCEERGYRPLADCNFGKEVKRRFDQMHKLLAGTRAERYWVYDGIKFSQDEICGEATNTSVLF